MICDYQVVHVKATGKHHRRFDVQLSEAEMAAFVEGLNPDRGAKYQPSPMTRALYQELAGALARSRDLTRRAS